MLLSQAEELITKFLELESEIQFQVIDTIIYHINSFSEVKPNLRTVANSLNVSEACINLIVYFNKYFESGDLKIIVAESEENISNVLNPLELKVLEKVVKIIELINENSKVAIFANKKVRVREIAEVIIRETVLKKLP